MQLTILDLVQRLYGDPLLLRQLPQMRSESLEIRLALANKRANGGRGSPTTLAWNTGDGVTHQFAHKV